MYVYGTSIQDLLQVTVVCLGLDLHTCPKEVVKKVCVYKLCFSTTLTLCTTQNFQLCGSNTCKLQAFSQIEVFKMQITHAVTVV